MPPFANYLSPFIGKFGRFKLYQNSWQPDYITVEIIIQRLRYDLYGWIFVLLVVLLFFFLE